MNRRIENGDFFLKYIVKLVMQESDTFFCILNYSSGLFSLFIVSEWWLIMYCFWRSPNTYSMTGSPCEPTFICSHVPWCYINREYCQIHYVHILCKSYGVKLMRNLLIKIAWESDILMFFFSPTRHTLSDIIRQILPMGAYPGSREV